MQNQDRSSSLRLTNAKARVGLGQSPNRALTVEWSVDDVDVGADLIGRFGEHLKTEKSMTKGILLSTFRFKPHLKA